MTDMSQFLSVAGGIFIGGAINYFVSKQAKDREWRLALIKEDILRREKLYSDFLVAIQSLLLEAADDKKISMLSNFGVIRNELARIELISTEPVVNAAVNLVDHALDMHAQEPENSGDNYVPRKKVFIAEVRSEIKSLQEA